MWPERGGPRAEAVLTQGCGLRGGQVHREVGPWVGACGEVGPCEGRDLLMDRDETFGDRK